MSSPFATVTNLSCLHRIRYHLSVSSYEKYHFCKQQINYYAENIERSQSLTGFSKYVTNIMLEKYEYYECTKRIGRT